MNAVVIGQRRQGKSTLALVQAAAKSDVIVIFDPNFNYRMPGVISVQSPDHLVSLLDDEELPPYSVLRIGPFDQEHLHEAFQVYSAVLWRYDNYSVLVDESHMLQTKNKIHPALDRFLRRSPADTHVFQTSHRLMELNGLSRYLIDTLILFRNEQPRELQLIQEQYNIEPETVSALGDRHYVHWYRDGKGNPHQFVQRDSASWYIDLHNPNSRRRTDGGSES